MEKVKVSKELAIAIEKGLKLCGEEELLRSQSGREKWVLDVYLPLNEISLIELAEILIKGYEVEKTPEEKILNMYNINNDFNCAFDRGYQWATKQILETLNIKIKGIND